MKNNNDLINLHIGKIIKEIAMQKGISSKEIATVIHYDSHNADKIFKMNDMSIDNVVRISYLLKYNILDFIAKNYLLHIPCTNYPIDTESCLLKIDMKNLLVTVFDDFNNSDFLKNTHIGRHIWEVVKKKKWNGGDLAKKLHCSQSTIIIILYCQSKGYSINPLKLQKLLYFVQAWYIVKFDKNPFISRIARSMGKWPCI
jgi:DNA-binding Xre family transcriptional regulator